MGQGTSAFVVGKPDKSSDSTLEFEPGHKIFAQTEKNKRVRAYTDSQMDFHSFEGKDEEMHKSSSGTSIVPQSVPTMFKWENGGNTVYLSGSFNGWNSRIPLHGSNGEFVTIIELPEGDHEYKFFVDGHWEHDKNAPTTNDNFGGRNNIITVKKSDFEVMEALDDDDRQSGSGITVSSSPPGSYGQLIPSHHNPVVIQDGMHASIPPALPPHLLNVILNKEVIDVNEPSLLQEPHHVSLNHLYALSIKEGVAVLSSTQRYREKYVTTLLYRPIK